MSDWSRTDRALARTMTFASFADAIAFTTRLGFYAEHVNHHPDIQISYTTVTVTWTTHDTGGLSAKDDAGALETDRLYSSIRR